jgi:hypothetical protein
MVNLYGFAVTIYHSGIKYERAPRYGARKISAKAVRIPASLLILKHSCAKLL